MSGVQLQVDPEIRAEFIDESLDSLTHVIQRLISLEKSKEPAEEIEVIFRSVHSIKGSAPYFGLMHLAHLSHEVENVLDSIRRGTVSVHHDLIDLLLECLDFLKAILERVLKGATELEDEATYNTLLSKLQQLLSAGKHSLEAVLQTILSHPAVLNTPDLREHMVQLVSLCDVEPKELDQNELMQSLKNTPSELDELQTLLQEPPPDLSIDLVEPLIQKLLSLNENTDAETLLQSALNELTLLSNTIGIGDQVTRDSFLEHLNSFAAKAKWTSTQSVSESSAEENISAPDASPAKPPPDTTKTLRVSEKSIEDFLEQVAELITVREMYSHLQLKIKNSDENPTTSSEFSQLNGMFTDLSNKLLYSIMEVRKVPAGNILNKVHRIVRDVAQAKQKEIDIEIIGDDLLIDKSIIELLEMPLVHMVRNAADHGIEPPDERQQRGKSSNGVINISLTESDESLILEVRDDGQGINLEKIREIAIEQGIITKNEKLEQKQLIDLLFKSGVSTAQEVTDISGRGVGMDVVRQNIKKAGGDISIETTAGEGSCFRIDVPQNSGTQIFNGFVVVAHSNKFIIPVSDVIKTFQLEKELHTTITGNREAIVYEDSIVPLLRLERLLFNIQEECTFQSIEQGTIVILEYDSFRFAVSIDAVDSIMQLVLKNVNGIPSLDYVFSGAALLGDGNIALVLDTEKLASLLDKK
ncbi:MAG: chemotaxis protein CheA [Fibrobacterales bacterium]